MLHVVFSNAKSSADKLRCSTSTIYRWLNGTPPSLKYILRIINMFHMDTDTQYLYNFFNLCNAIKNMELDEALLEIKVSALSKEDKFFLQELCKKKWWQSVLKGDMDEQ